MNDNRAEGFFSLHLQLPFHGKFLDSGDNEEWRIPIKFQFMFNIPSLIEKFLSFLADGACFMDHAADSFSLHIWWVIGIKENVTSIMVTFPVDLHSQCSSVFGDDYIKNSKVFDSFPCELYQWSKTANVFEEPVSSAVRAAKQHTYRSHRHSSVLPSPDNGNIQFLKHCEFFDKKPKQCTIYKSS
jgi:hypothetical protein